MSESSVPEFADTRAALVARAEAVNAPPAAPEPPAPAAEPEPPAPATPLEPAPAPAPAQAVAPPALAPEPQPQPAVPEAPASLADVLAQIKALEARISGAPAAPGAPPASPPAPAAEPLPAPPDPQQVHVYAQQAAQSVDGIPQVIAEYQDTVKAVGKQDAFGGWIPGTLGVAPNRGGYSVPELDGRIETLRVQLDPERARAARLPVIDELSRDDYRRALDDLQQERRNRIDAFRDGRERAAYLADRYQRVYDAAKNQALQSYQEAVAQREYDAQLDSLANDIRSRWQSEFNGVLAEIKVDTSNKDLTDRLWSQVQLQGRLASNEEVAPDRLRGWLKNVISGELGWVDNYHRLRSGEYGKGKVQAAGAAVAAPRAATGTPGAPPPAAPAASTTWDGMDNRMRLRAAFGQRRRA